MRISIENRLEGEVLRRMTDFGGFWGASEDMRMYTVVLLCGYNGGMTSGVCKSFGVGITGP